MFLFYLFILFFFKDKWNQEVNVSVHTDEHIKKLQQMNIYTV